MHGAENWVRACHLWIRGVGPPDAPTVELPFLLSLVKMERGKKNSPLAFVLNSDQLLTSTVPLPWFLPHKAHSWAPSFQFSDVSDMNISVPSGTDHRFCHLSSKKWNPKTLSLLEVVYGWSLLWSCGRTAELPCSGGGGWLAPRPPRTSRGFESSKCLTGRDTKISKLILHAIKLLLCSPSSWQTSATPGKVWETPAIDRLGTAPPSPLFSFFVTETIHLPNVTSW